MSKWKFKIGDRVRCVKYNGVNQRPVNECGTVIHIDDGVLVEFDKDINGHSGNGRGKYKHCWWVNYGELEPICKFKVGDIVISNNNYYGITRKGWIGKVVELNADGTFSAEGDSGLFWKKFIFQKLNPKDFDLYTGDQPNKIVITTDGKTTTAKMYRDKTVIGVQTTKCHPDDRFDFTVGARIAFDRLVGEKKEEPEKPKYYNGKVVCVDIGTNSCYTKGKIYQFKDGMFTDEKGITHGTGYGDRGPYKTFEDWQKYSHSKWLEVVE